MFAQVDTNLGLLPKVVVSKKLTEVSKWIQSVEQRTIVYDEEYQFSHSLLDISSIYSLKTSTNQSFNFGYILRLTNSEIIHRTFQHYNFVQTFNALKVGHRFAFEQFYQLDKQTTFRTRYRVSAQQPLNGERVDVKEFYLKLGNENLYNLEALTSWDLKPFALITKTSSSPINFSSYFKLNFPLLFVKVPTLVYLKFTFAKLMGLLVL